MPSKLDDASNLRFLHACLLSSDYSRIDFARVAHKHGIQPPAARMRFARLNTALGGKSKARKRAGSPDSNDKNGSGGKKKAPKEGLEVGKPRTEEDEEDLGVMKVEEGAEIKKEEVSDEAMEHAVSPSFMESPPDLAQQGVPMDSVFPSPQVGGLPLDYAYTQAFAASQQPMPPMPYYQPQLPFGYPRGSVDFQQPSAGYEYPPMDEEWQMDAK